MEYKEKYRVKSKEWHLGLDLTETLHHTILHLAHTHSYARTQGKEVQTFNFIRPLFKESMALLEDALTTILEKRS